MTTQVVVAEPTAKDAEESDAVRQSLSHVEIVAPSTPDPLLITGLTSAERDVSRLRPIVSKCGAPAQCS